MTVDINLILQLLILVVGLLGAYLVRKGLVDRKTVEDTKTIAGAITTAVDKVKLDDPDVGKKITGKIVEAIGENKPILDAFLKATNLNQPNGK
jgi:hypothetical protein